MKEWVQRLPGMKQGKVYIVPTQNGLIFLAGTAVVIVAGATYNNNLVFLLGFFLFAIFVISMVETHNNLRDLMIEALPIGDQHAGEPVSIPLRLVNKGYARRQMIELSPLKKELVYGQVLCIEDVASSQQVVRNLVCGPMVRGVHQVPAMSLSTVFPLGLFRAWKVLRADGEFFLYPNPSGHLPLRLVAEENKFPKSEAIAGHQRGDEFREHRKYERGESYHRVDWKIFARRRRLMIKEYEGTTDRCFSVRFQDVPNRDVEKVLSQMSRWLDQARERGAPFELVLPGKRLNFGYGPHHYQKCQRELARYGEVG
ncbi:MAG: DUF58 domain-containing protein [Bdellovibrionaceae bacterium]|nr:DUF58 domain-containing protein [Bdellovibrionales bacterium]MCB9084036.1 DUF58 domain-containing protein [Pseudobdellovibrionaceae bacterium]